MLALCEGEGSHGLFQEFKEMNPMDQTEELGFSVCVRGYTKEEEFSRRCTEHSLCSGQLTP